MFGDALLKVLDLPRLCLRYMLELILGQPNIIYTI